MAAPAKSPASQRLWFLLLLSLSHGVVDVSNGSVVALLPTLRDHFSLSYTLIGNIILIAQLTSSFTQPFFGLLSDRSSQRWLLLVSPLVAGVGVALMGFAANYWLLLGAVVFSSLGVAAFHPEGAHAAHQLAGERRVMAMSIYGVGGNIGYAMAPIYIGLLLAVAGGIHGTAWAVVIPLALSVVLLRLLPKLTSAEANLSAHAAGRRAQLPAATDWRGLSLITIFTMLRSVIQFGIITYVPFYWIDVLGHNKSTGPYVLFMYLLAGVAGTLLGAPLADRIGTKRLVVVSFTALLGFQVLILFTRGWLLLVALFCAGFLVVATAIVTLVMSQDYAPRQLGLASGLNLGLAFGSGGLATVFLGMLADRHGIIAVLWAIAAITPLALLFAAILPPVRRQVLPAPVAAEAPPSA